MNNKSKSDNFASFSSTSSEENSKEKDFNITYTNSAKSNSDQKNEGCNDWSSVPVTYDKEESCHKHEKSATDNQWCSCSK